MSSSSVVGGLTAGIAAVVFFLLHKRQVSSPKESAPAPAAAVVAAPVESAAAAEAEPAATADADAASTPAEKARRSKALRKQWDKEKLKMVLCVRNDLGMGKGKMMAQCCHAAVGVVQELSKTAPELIASWDWNGAMKIALKVNSEEDLLTLESKADELGLGNYLVCDAGHTQIPADSKTVLAIGPAPAKVLDKLTGHLKLM